jgi:hypothetical protein
MSSKTYSLNFPLKVEPSATFESLSSLNHDLSRSFDSILQAQNSSPSQIASLKTHTFAVISKWMELYTQESSKIRREKQRLEALQTEAAKEWNSRQMDLVKQLDLFEARTQTLAKQSREKYLEREDMAQGLEKLAKIAEKMFGEIGERLKEERMKFETQMKVEKTLHEFLEMLQKCGKSGHKSLQSQNTDASDYLRPGKDDELFHARPLESDRMSASSLSYFLEDTYQKTLGKDSIFGRNKREGENKAHAKKPSIDTFRTNSEVHEELMDSFVTINEESPISEIDSNAGHIIVEKLDLFENDRRSSFENTVSTIFPPIEQETESPPYFLSLFKPKCIS